MEEERSTTMNRTPSWLSTEDDRLRLEVHHVWKPRPLGRSILWTPIGPARRDEPTGSYEVFLEQRTLETMYRHVWGADPDDAPFGYLFGDLCEDRESRSRYVIITRAVASAYPFLENKSDQMADEAVTALRREVRSNSRVLAGWYHRHREGPARLSAEDAATHRAHFAEPWQVAFLFVTDPEEPAGGCFQPQTCGDIARALLPFHELVGAASLLAKGVCRTRIDWENVETRTEVIVEALPRTEVFREASAIDREVAFSAELQVESALEDTNPRDHDADPATQVNGTAREAAAPPSELPPQQTDIEVRTPDVSELQATLNAAEVARRQAEEEEAAKQASGLQAVLDAAEAARQAAAEKAARSTAELEAARRQAEDEAATQAAELQAALDVADAARQAAAEDTARRTAELEVARKAAEEESERQAAQAAAAIRAAEEEAEKQAAELQTTLNAAEVARRQAEEEAVKQASELQATLEAAEAARQAAAEKAARGTAELEAARRQAEDEAATQAAELQATLNAAEAARQAAAEDTARRTAELELARKAAEEESERQAAQAAAAIRAVEEDAEILLPSQPPGAVQARRWGQNAAVDSVLVAAAIVCIVVGAWPLRYGNPTTTNLPSLTAALAGFVMPARAPAPALKPAEERDPLALLGRDLRATIGRYRTIAAMFDRRRLACAPLREAYVEVDKGWTAYSIALARNRDGLSEGLAFRDESVYREVQEVEADFTASGCDRP